MRKTCKSGTCELREQKIEFSIEERREMFKDIIQYFSEPRFIQIAISMLSMFPDYFFYVPASSTGKYHPDFSNGRGGLVRHTLQAMRIAYDLFEIETFTTDAQDKILLALLCHDAYKYDEPMRDFTAHEHPLLGATYFRQNFGGIGGVDAPLLTHEEIDEICSMISSHMGKWTTSKRSQICLPEPVTSAEKFVHLCDYLSSLKYQKFYGEETDTRDEDNERDQESSD